MGVAQHADTLRGHVGSACKYYFRIVIMCKYPNGTVDSAAGVGDLTDPAFTEMQLSSMGWQLPDPDEQDSCVITQDLLKQKNAELAALQSQLLTLPRGERKLLRQHAASLDAHIKLLCADFTHSSEIEQAAVALNKSLAACDPDAIAQALEGLTLVDLAKVDELALCYLISASEKVLLAMQCYPSHAGVIKGSLSTLCNLLGGLQQLNNGYDISQQLCSDQAGQVVLDAMAQQLEDRDVQYFGCWLISILASFAHADGTSINDRICFTTGARVAVARARRQHKDETTVTQWADVATKLL